MPPRGAPIAGSPVILPRSPREPGRFALVPSPLGACLNGKGDTIGEGETFFWRSTVVDLQDLLALVLTLF